MQDDDADHDDDQPRHERRDADARRGDLDRAARAAADATWGERGERGEAEPGDRGRRGTGRVPGAGLVTGDVGTKGEIAARHRADSRRASREGERVPSGTTSPGGGRYLLGAMLLVAAGALALALLIGWLAS